MRRIVGDLGNERFREVVSQGGRPSNREHAVTMIATAVRIGLTPFSVALEERDGDALLAMFGPNAEIRLSNCATALQPPRSVTGKAAIAHRIFRFCLADQDIRVVDEVDQGNELTIIAECRQLDGSLFVLAINATLVDGLVTRQFVVLV